MIDKQLSQFLTKLIEDTKSGKVLWVNMQRSNTDIKPKQKVQDAFENSHSTISLLSESPDMTKSYYTEYQNGRFYLLFYSSMLGLNRVCLLVETESSKYSTSLIDSEYDKDSENEVISLKRLYNLVENSTSEILSLINSYLLDD